MTATNSAGRCSRLTYIAVTLVTLYTDKLQNFVYPVLKCIKTIFEVGFYMQKMLDMHRNCFLNILYAQQFLTETSTSFIPVVSLLKHTLKSQSLPRNH